MSEPIAAPATTADPAAAAPATAAPVAPAKPTDDMSAKFASLAKKERNTRLAAINLKRQQETLDKTKQEIAERQRQWEEEFKSSPLEAIKKRGFSYQDLTNAALNDGKLDPSTEVKTVKNEFERFKQEQAEKEKKAQEDQQTAAQRALEETVNTFKASIVEKIEANKDKYELTSLYEASELVFQTVEEHFTRTSKEGKPKILSIDEACELVEQYLESEVDRMATTSKKFQAKYSSAKPKEGEPAKPAPKTSTTLSNDLNTSAAPSLLPAHTENDRMKRAIAALG